jgi:hypothetical protein
MPHQLPYKTQPETVATMLDACLFYCGTYLKEYLALYRGGYVVKSDDDDDDDDDDMNVPFWIDKAVYEKYNESFNF